MGAPARRGFAEAATRQGGGDSTSGRDREEIPKKAPPAATRTLCGQPNGRPYEICQVVPTNRANPHLNAGNPRVIRALRALLQTKKQLQN